MAVYAALSLAASTAGANAQTAAGVWRGLQAVTWSATAANWQHSHPNADCVRFPQQLKPYQGDDNWSIACEQDAAGYRARWFFYALDDRKPLAPRLEQFRASLAASPATAHANQQALEKRITAVYGRPVSPDHSNLREFGAAHWRNIRRWRTPELEIYLYVDTSIGHPATVELLIRDRHLLAARAEIRRLQRSAAVAGIAIQKQIDAKLAQRLGQKHPKLADLLASAPHHQNPSRVMAALVRLLRKSSNAPAGERPALMMAADSLARHLWCRPPSACEAARKQLAGFGLTFRWSELDGMWIYQHDLLWRVWKNSGSTSWGRDAFLLLNRHGWDTSGRCVAGPDRFRAVIKHGEAFLAENPPGRLRLQVLFDLARAYETWWSLSFGENGGYADPSKYQEGAEAARQEAISAYGRIISLAPASDQAAYARLRLTRLKLGYDTGQWAFYCIYD